MAVIMRITIQCLVIVSFLVSSYCAESADSFQHEQDATTLSWTSTTSANITITTNSTTNVTKELVSIELVREWEDLVVGGSTAVNFFGLLMVSASRHDLVLTPRAGYSVQFIKNLNSLNATLLQVASAMQVALQSAHEDLIYTQVSMNQIPEHMKASLLLIQGTSDNLREKLLSYTLRNVDRAAAEASVGSKMTLSRFVQLGKLIDEVVAVIASTLFGIVSNMVDYYFLSEVELCAIDVQVKWYLLVELFIKFSDTADIIRENVAKNFVKLIDQVQSVNGFSTGADRLAQLIKFIPTTIGIDQSIHFLQTIARTYADISNEYLITQIAQSDSLLSLQTDGVRMTSQRDAWQRIVLQSVKVARLAQQRQNEFVQESIDRQAEYKDFLSNTHIATLTESIHNEYVNDEHWV